MPNRLIKAGKYLIQKKNQTNKISPHTDKDIKPCLSFNASDTVIIINDAVNQIN